MWPSLIIIGHIIVIIGVSLRVIMMRLPVGTALAWIVLIFFLPFAGAAIYLVLGEKMSPLRTLLVRFDLRLHRKIVVIDDEIAYTGSFNLVDPRFFKQEAGVGQWVDGMARIQGPAVLTLNPLFLWCWF